MKTSNMAKDLCSLPVQRRNARWWHLSNAALRMLVLRGMSRPFADNLVVNEYPKSGGTWLSQMLSEALGLPYPRNRLPMLGSCLMQCHVLNPFGMRNVVVIWRDGRDVMVSFYHHLLFGHEFADGSEQRKVAELLNISDPADVSANLPAVIEALMKKRIGPRFNWPEFVSAWHGRPGVIETRYEDLLDRPAQELARIVHEAVGSEPDADAIEAIVERYSFRNQSQSKDAHGDGSSRGQFLRKGISGDWENHFTNEAEAVFWKYAKEQMHSLGYDTD